MDKKQNDIFKSDVGFAVRQLRERMGLTQVQFGEKLGLDSYYISKIERGLKPVSLFRLFELLSRCDEESASYLISNITMKVKNYDSYNRKTK